jgi:hypothetical protein
MLLRLSFYVVDGMGRGGGWDGLPEYGIECNC